LDGKRTGLKTGHHKERKRADLKVGTMRKVSVERPSGEGNRREILDCAGRRVRRSERGRKDVGLLRSNDRFGLVVLRKKPAKEGTAT